MSSINLGQIKNSQVLVEPSKKLIDYVKNIKSVDKGTPLGIQNIIYKNKVKDKLVAKQTKLEYLLTEHDKEFITFLLSNDETELCNKLIDEDSNECSTNTRHKLTLQDLHWVYDHIQKVNKHNDGKVYLHELLEGSEIVLPKNEQIPRNEELERRCQILKAEQQNREYQKMTRNVDGFRKRLPDDTIGYQLRMMNRHLIAVFQFIVSILTGFAFGFIGLELLVGSLDFGLRLLLGMVCALVIAVAELYFLAKKLNEDLEFETSGNTIQNPAGKNVK